MSNCRPGDIGVITWDEEPLLGNKGKRVKVLAAAGTKPGYGVCWYISPVDDEKRLLFIDTGDGETVKCQAPEDKLFWHPDKWLRRTGETYDVRTHAEPDVACTSRGKRILQLLKERYGIEPVPEDDPIYQMPWMVFSTGRHRSK